MPETPKTFDTFEDWCNAWVPSPPTRDLDLLRCAWMAGKRSGYVSAIAAAVKECQKEAVRGNPSRQGVRVAKQGAKRCAGRIAKLATEAQHG